MNIVVLQGTLSSEPVERTLPSGLTISDWTVSTQVDSAKLKVPVKWTEPSKAVQSLGEGDHVVVVGSVRQRFYQAGGTLVSRTEVVGEHVTKPTQKVATSKLLSAVGEELAP